MLSFCVGLTNSQSQSLHVKTEQLRILTAKAEKFELIDAENKALIVENSNQKAQIKDLHNQLAFAEGRVISLRKQRNWIIAIYIFSLVFLFLARSLFLKKA